MCLVHRIVDMVTNKGMNNGTDKDKNTGTYVGTDKGPNMGINRGTIWVQIRA